MLYTIRFLNGKPVCCGDVSLPNDITRASAESAGYICMESDTEPEFFTRWVHTTPESPGNVGDKSSGIGSIAIVLTDAEYDALSGPAEPPPLTSAKYVEETTSLSHHHCLL